jgi:hypothetical protein
VYRLAPSGFFLRGFALPIEKQGVLFLCDYVYIFQGNHHASELGARLTCRFSRVVLEISLALFSTRTALD